jgi:hypothetical protein
MKIVEAFARWLGWTAPQVVTRAPAEKPTIQVPPDLNKFFETHGLCPDCGEKDWREFQDGGHDTCITCNHCGASFGIQLPPFNMLERIPTPQKVEETA